MQDQNDETPAQRFRHADPRFVAPRIYAIATVLRRATNLFTRRQTGLPPAGGRIMILLGEAQPMSLNDLAERSALDRGQLSRGLSELVEANLVRRQRHGRSVMHSLTEEGEERYAELLLGAEDRNDQLLEGLTDGQRQEFLRILEMMVERAHGLHERELERDRQAAALPPQANQPE